MISANTVRAAESTSQLPENPFQNDALCGVSSVTGSRQTYKIWVRATVPAKKSPPRHRQTPLPDVDSSNVQTASKRIFFMADRSNGSKTTRTETEASGGSKEGVVRYVLIFGVGLVVLGFIIAYLMR